jgi:hypothetical protein
MTSTWYVTAPSSRWITQGGQIHRGPAERAHAKAMGATRTACGLFCGSWPKFLHLPYLPGRGGITCHTCDLLVSSVRFAPENRHARTPVAAAVG